MPTLRSVVRLIRTLDLTPIQAAVLFYLNDVRDPVSLARITDDLNEKGLGKYLNQLHAKRMVRKFRGGEKGMGQIYYQIYDETIARIEALCPPRKRSCY